MWFAGQLKGNFLTLCSILLWCSLELMLVLLQFFMVADTLLHRRIGKKVEAALHVSISSLLAWMFPADKNYGRQAEGALRAMAGLLTANGLALLKSRARTQQGHQIGRLLSPKQRSVLLAWFVSRLWGARQKGCNWRACALATCSC